LVGEHRSSGSHPPSVVVLAGGTGGAKLARGTLDIAGERLAVIANTADDVDVYGVRVSPDPDLVTYWLADLIDEDRGFGIAGDTDRVMRALRAAGHPAWFELGDRDLATCLLRSELLRAGARPTIAAARVAEAAGVVARVLPMSDEPVATFVRSGGRWLPFQEFMVVERASAPIEGVELRGAEGARPTEQVLAAIGSADAIVIGPSNPVTSIAPILSVDGMRDALARAAAPVVAVSPFVGGRALKGPTEAFCAHAGLEIGVAGIQRAYGELLDGVVADEPLEAASMPGVVADTLMDSPQRRRSLAAATLEFAASL
jgi:LPPG:FO 2-phospho-L-lactate transferase